MQSIDTRAILDMKWSNTQPFLAVVTSSGQILIYEIKSDEENSPKLTLKFQHDLEDKPVALSLDWNDR